MSGRQHQIRKHAALAKHPLVGDNRYNDKAYNKNIAARYSQERLWLHAEKIKFLFKGKEYYFENNLTMDLFFSNTAKNA